MIAVKRGPIIGGALAAAAAVVLVAGVPVSRLLPWLVLACPLLMLVMHRGGHGAHCSHGAAHAESRDEVHIAKQ